MSRAVRIDRHAGPEEMKLVEVTVGEPGPGEIRIRHKALGLNFIDVYQRSGLYPLPMPALMGNEASGVVEAVGAGVTHLKVGDRAAYASRPPGAYCDVRVMPAATVCKLPDNISFETGAAMMLKGMTVQYLLRRTYKVQKGDTILVQAAAGGVGLILCQWAKHLGATVIGTVSSDEKAALAKANGAEFDRLFLTGMIQHHIGALDMVDDLFGTPGAGQEPALYDFAVDIDNTQRAEIDTMRKMLKETK